jgi:ribonuclease P protein component
MAYGFKKNDRFRKRVEFAEISRSGKKLQDQHYIVFLSPGKFDCSRLGVTASRKIGNAVIRNRTKRLCREVFRINRRDFRGIWDISIVAKKPAVNLTYIRAESALKRLLSCIWKDGADQHCA